MSARYIKTPSPESTLKQLVSVGFIDENIVEGSPMNLNIQAFSRAGSVTYESAYKISKFGRKFLENGFQIDHIIEV